VRAQGDFIEQMRLDELDNETWKAICNLVRGLACGTIEAALERTSASRLTADEIRASLMQYGRTLIELPIDARSIVDTYRIADTMSIAIDVPLWTKEEGRSDLTLSLTLTRVGGAIQIAVEDLHVL